VKYCYHEVTKRGDWTDEMAELISYMRQYNESASEAEDLRFYGFDMQRIAYSMKFLTEICEELEVDTTNLQKLVEGENGSVKDFAQIGLQALE